MANLSMSARIEIETQNMKPTEVKELFLDNCKGTTIEGLTDKYSELEVLSMINIGLTSIKGFPAFPKLKSLELSDNKLSEGLEYLKGCPNIISLKIANNRIKEMSALEPLKLLSGLASLDLMECPITTGDNYRSEIFAALPQLTFLDGIDKDGNAEPDSDEDFELSDEEEEYDDDDEIDSEEEGEEEDDDEDGDEEAPEDEDDDEENDEGVEEEDSEEPSAKRTKLDENGVSNGDDVSNGLGEHGNNS